MTMDDKMVEKIERRRVSNAATEYLRGWNCALEEASDILRDALASHPKPEAPDKLVERLKPWLQHHFHCLSQRDLHNDTLCRCGLNEALATFKQEQSQ